MALKIVLGVLALAFAVAGFSPLQYERPRGIQASERSAPQQKVTDNFLQKAFTKARLPKTAHPVSYDLTISPILDEGVPNHPQWSAPGSVTILINADVATNRITLNSVGLTYSTATVKPADTADPTVFVVAIALDPENEFVHLDLDSSLVIDKQYIVTIDFVAPVSITTLFGIYRTSYVNPGTGETSYVAVTQFEATSARQAFPCFDEPDIKATFKITIGYNKDKYIALGNGAFESEAEFPGMPTGWVKSVFKQTVDMSTYLVAFVVADFNYVEAVAGLFDKPVRVYGPPHLIGNNDGAQYAADTAAKLLKFYQDRYEIEYKLDKLDSAAVTDFEFGAMENWGLNLYREPLLLQYDEGTTENERQTITLILAHELSHQWFGNLVTCQWWSYMWLNEGFATYNEFIATEFTNPEFDYYASQQNDALQLAMVTDGNPAATHPLVNGALYNETNVEIFVNFDRITYQKGGALIRMMEGFLGPETFKAGLISYLNKMSFKGAHQDDLFNVLTEQALADGAALPEGVTVRDIMNTWSLQTGYPVVRVTRSGDSAIYVSQERFNSEVQYAEESELDLNELWTIPVAVATADNPDFTTQIPAFWIEKDVLLKSADYDTTKWLVVNAGGTGYYRVLYDTPLRNLITAQLNQDSSVIDQFTRSQLIDDYFTFAAHKFSQIEDALSFTKYLGNEIKPVVWNAVLVHLRGILNKLSGTSAYQEFKNYWVTRIGQVLENPAIGLEQAADDKGARVTFRLQLLDWACALEHAGCREYASRLFSDWMASSDPAVNPIPIDIRPVVYCAAVAESSTAFEQVFEKYKLPTTTPKARAFLLSALACSADTARLLELLLQVQQDPSEFLTNADKITILQKLAANPQIRNQAVDFVRTNAADLIARLTTRSVISFIGALANYVGTPAELENINYIIENNAFSDAEKRTLSNYVSTIQKNIIWRTENEDRLSTWFSENI